MAEPVLVVIGLYLAIGLLVGVPFVLIGISRVDAVARTSSVRFRVLMLPGTVGLWPIMLAKWVRAGSSNDGGDA